MVHDEERKPPGKNKRPRPWMLEVRYVRGIGSNWGWMKRGIYRTEAEALKSGEHFKRGWSDEKEIRITNVSVTSQTSKTN